MSGSGAADQPLTGFGYGYWFACGGSGCGGRVEIEGELFELQCTGQADYSVCASCGTVVDVRDQSPTRRNLEDVALQDDSVARLVWYHSSRYEDWPDVEAYTADVTAEARQTAEMFDMYDADQRIAAKLSLAVHLGTYEATIENILRRLEDQDHANVFDAQYWLHRVEISIDRPHDLHSEVVEEFHTMFGDVEMSQLDALGGARAARYVNLHEAIGSVSLAIDPVLVESVSTISLPVPEAAVAETAAATTATASIVAALQSEIGDTYGVWADFVRILQSEYLSGVNPQVREPFLGAVGGQYEDPFEFHRRFRILAGLLKRPDVAIDLLAAAPRRHV